jgi:cell division protein FtsQ
VIGRGRKRARGHGPTRMERAAAVRRSRALAHLERTRGQRSAGERVRGSQRSAALLLGVSIGAGALLGSPLLSAAHWLPGQAGRVDAIHVSGAEHLRPEQIAAATGVAPGAALASIDPGEIEARLAQVPWIARARAVRLPGGPLVVGVEERVPVAVLRAGQSSALVDRTGTAFAPIEGEAPANLLRLLAAGGIELGEADPRLAAALELDAALRERGLARPAEVRVAAADDPDGLSLRLPGLDARIVLGWDEPDARLDALAQLLAAGAPELADAVSLDLRFADRAVLRHEPSRNGAAKAADSRGGAAPSGPRPPG